MPKFASYVSHVLVKLRYILSHINDPIIIGELRFFLVSGETGFFS